MMSAISVPIRFFAAEPFSRRGEPVTCGLPWPRGVVESAGQFRLVGPDGRAEPVQATVLDRWPDGTVRWCLFDFLATTGTEDEYRIEVGDDASFTGPAWTPVVVGGRFFLTARPAGGSPVEVTVVGRLVGPDGADEPLAPTFRVEGVDGGPVRTRVQFHADRQPDGLELFGHVDTFAGTPVVRVQLTLRNPRPAAHPGGNWDLGNAGSVFLRDLSVAVRSAGPGAVRCSSERGSPFATYRDRCEVYQDSSGGENWAHHNHFNRSRVVPHKFRGYRLTGGDQPARGLRATPVAVVESAGGLVGVTMPRFWENFPKAVEADPGGVVLRLFPEQSTDAHELQGGEQKTHVFYIAFDRDAVTDEPLAWCRSPLVAHADPEWYAAAGAFPDLVPAAADPNAGYRALIDQAVEGPDTFFAKREAIDEYGWRHFGDVYGDHEAVFHKGPEALVSHYNNQFDVVFGCGVHFLRSADPRWWDLLLPAADHTCDIDVYHTDGDKPAYNRGLFWPTFHYNDADTGGHRGYPRSLRGPALAVPGRDFGALGETGDALRRAVAAGVGGGPSASHIYNHGLVLAYFLTGNPVYRDVAVGLARYVIAADAPRRLFRLLSAESTGAASASGSEDYHGPGRASGNAVLTLLAGHRLTGDAAFLEKAEEVIRRVSHPRQDLAALDLLNAEWRWFYTMHLQALGRHLDYKAELGQLDRMYAYARLTLLHYARWMAANERPVLDEPWKLQYPTETWAAQDMRKVEVFQHAARHAAGDEKARFLERAEWFFRYVERTLAGFPTKSLCRPVVLMMTTGWSRAWWQAHPDAAAPPPAVAATPEEFGDWRMFVPQKTIALRRAKWAAAAGVAAGVTLLVWLLLTWI